MVRIRDAFRFMSGNVLVFALTDVLGNFARSMVFPFASLYILALGGDATRIGLVNSLMPLAGLLVFPIGGYIADHTDRVRVVVFANALSTAIVLMYVLAPRWEVIAAGALLHGVVVFQFPASSSLIADSLHPEGRGRGIATMNTLSNSLAILAPGIAGAVVGRYGPDQGVRFLYGAMFVAYLAATLILARFLRETSPRPGEGLRLAYLVKAFGEAYRTAPALLRQLPRPLKALAGVIVLSFMANGVSGAFWVVYALEQVGLSPQAWGVILFIEAVVRCLLFIPAGVLVDRWGRTVSLLAALGVSLVAIPSFALARSFAAVLCLRLAVAVGFALAIPASTALMADLVPREVRGRVMAALGQGGILIGMTGGGTGGPGVGYLVTFPLIVSSLAGGYLYAYNPAYPWVFVLFASAAAILLTVCFVRDPQQAEV